LIDDGERFIGDEVRRRRAMLRSLMVDGRVVGGRTKRKSAGEREEKAESREFSLFEIEI
jgi:hypothetical protein